MSIPERVSVPSDLASVDAPPATRVWVDSDSCSFQAVPRNFATTGAVHGPTDALTPVSWQPANVMESDEVAFGPPRGSGLDDGPALQSLLTAEAAGLRRKVVWRGGTYTIDTSVHFPVGLTRMLLNSAVKIVTTLPQTSDPADSLFYTGQFGSNGLPATTLIAAVAIGDWTVDVAAVASQQIAAGVEICIGDAAHGGIIRRTVIGTPSAISGGFRVALDRPATAITLIAAPVQNIVGSGYTLDIDGGGATITGTAFRYFQVARNAHSRIRNFVISDESGVAGQIGSWDNVGFDNIASHFSGRLSTGTLLAWSFESNEFSGVSDFRITGLGEGFTISGCHQCYVRDSSLGLPKASGTTVYFSAEQAHPSVGNYALNVTSTGGLQGAKFAGQVDATVGNCYSQDDRIIECTFLHTTAFGIDLGETLVRSPVVAGARLSPPITPVSNWTGIIQRSGISADAQLSNISVSTPTTSGYNYMIRSADGVAVRGATLRNIALARFDSAITQDFYNIQSTFAGASVQFAYADSSGVRVRIHNSTLVASGASPQFSSDAPTWCIELHDTTITMSGGAYLSYNATANGTRFRLYGSSAPSFVSSINAVSNRQSVTLDGTEQDVAFPDARAGDVVTVSTTTAGGTPAARSTRLLAGTGAYVRGAAGDTSTVQVTIS